MTSLFTYVTPNTIAVSENPLQMICT